MATFRGEWKRTKGVGVGAECTYGWAQNVPMGGRRMYQGPQQIVVRAKYVPHNNIKLGSAISFERNNMYVETGLLAVKTGWWGSAERVA
jgi:hypothetical protein